MKKFTKIIQLSILAIVFACTTVFAQTTYYVNASTGNDGFSGTAANTPFATISHAIFVATAGSTIIVDDGTYTEDLVVNTSSLKLISMNGSSSTTIQLVDGVGINLQAGATNFTLGASGQGFTILTGGTTTFLVQLENAPSGATIQYNLLNAIGNATMGISIGAAGASNLTVSNNTFSCDVGDGAIFGPTVTNVDISNNTFNDPGANTSGYAIQFSGTAGGTIFGNTITGYGSGVFLYGLAALVDGVAIDNNNITGCAKGIRLGHSAMTKDVQNITVTQNTLTSNTTGIFMQEQDGVGDFAGTVVINNNSITGTGTQFDNTTTFIPDATLNWWGTINGPAHSSNTFNVGSQGSAVSDNVNFVPWLNAAPPGGTSYAPVTIGVNSYPSIQAAVTAASTGNTINIADGTYSEAVSINKDLTLTGTGTPTATSFTLTNGADVSGSSNIHAPVVNVDQVGAVGAKIGDGILLVSTPGGTVNVGTGTYAEAVIINKSVSLVGTGSSTATSFTLTNSAVLGSGSGGISAPVVNVDGPTSKIQDGITLVSSPAGTVNVGTGTYSEAVSINKSLNLAGTGASTATSFTLTNGAVLGSGSGGISAPTVNVDQIGSAGAKIGDGVFLLSTSGTLNVAAGSYSEAVTINKNLVLVGTGSPTATSFTLTNGVVLGGGSGGITASEVNILGTGSKIGDGILLVSSPAGTVNVTSGTYSEDVTINKSLNLVGTSATTATSFTLTNGAVLGNGSGNMSAPVVNVNQTTQAGAKIQDAIFLVSTPGGTVNVATGAYTEAVTINKNLTLVGSGNPTATSFTITDGTVLGSNTTGITAATVNVGGSNSKIQDGILLVSGNGTVNVATGAYTEDVTINKNLALAGTGASTATSFTLTNTAVLQGGSGGITAPVVNVNQAGGAGAKIQDGVLLVSPGGSINVASGTYPENVTIAKNLTLLADAPPYAIIAPAAGACITVTSGTNVAVHGFSLSPTSGFAMTNNTASTVDGTNIWWGTTDALTIPSRISNTNGGSVTFDPYFGKPVATNITNASLFNTLTFQNSNASVTFTQLPDNTNATINVSQTPTLPDGLPILTNSTDVFLTITSTGLTNGQFAVTIVLDVSNIAGFTATSQVYFYNSTANSWEVIAGTYNGTAETFTFETNHFTTFGFTGTNNTPYDITFGNIVTNNTATISVPVKLNTNGNAGFKQFQAKFTYPGSKMNFLSGNIGTGTLMNTNGWVTYFQEKAGSAGVDTIMVLGVGVTETTGNGSQSLLKLNFKIIDPATGSAFVSGHESTFYANGANNVFFVGSAAITYTTGSSTERGDATLDGFVTIDDVNSILDHLNNLSLLTGQALINAQAADNDSTTLTSNDITYILYYITHGNTWPTSPPAAAPSANVTFADAVQQSQGVYNLLNLPVNINAGSKVINNLEMIVTFEPSKVNYQSFRQDDATLVNGQVAGIIVDARDNVMATNLGPEGNKVRFLFASGDAEQNITPGKIIFNVIGTNPVLTSEYRINSESTFHTGPSYGIATAIDNESTIPTEYSISQNYPNPFNPSSIIKYGLPEASLVTIKIYNILGQEVKTLINTEKSAGTYSVQWNGDNDFGHKVSSGTYIYRIVAGSFVETKKMVLLK